MLRCCRFLRLCSHLGRVPLAQTKARKHENRHILVWFTLHPPLYFNLTQIYVNMQHVEHVYDLYYRRLTLIIRRTLHAGIGAVVVVTITGDKVVRLHGGGSKSPPMLGFL